MKILILNQAFHPDIVATAQQATDLARELALRGHEVTVLAGRHAYGRGSASYPRSEKWEGIRILRVSALQLGKRSRLARAANFGSFLVTCTLRMMRLRRFDVVVAMTSPPLIGVLAALFTRFKGGALVQWVMDLNPDEAIAAGWLRKDAAITHLLEGMFRWSILRSRTIIVLDRFMKERIEARIEQSAL